MKWGESECGQERLSKISCCCPLTNGAPTLDAPLVIQVTNGAPSGGATLVCLDQVHQFILMAHPGPGAPLLVTTSNGALCLDAPLVCLDRRTSSKKIDTNGAPWARCAISSFNSNGVSEGGAPLVYTNGAPLVWCAISVNPIYSPFSSSDSSVEEFEQRSSLKKYAVFLRGTLQMS